MNNIIQTKDLIKIYPGAVGTKALDGVSIKIPDGKIVAIIGQSGSGKSTLLNILGTLDTPTSGEVRINGKLTNEKTKDELALFRNQTIGFVFQFHYLLPEFSVIENVMIPHWIEKNTNGIHKRAEDLLDFVGIKEIANKPSNDISGGQKQRTAIARALMNEPKILLADEPTGNLDSESSGKVLDLFEKINKEKKTTFVMITHDDRVANRADIVIELKDGKVI